ncbi:PEP-CTERM system histidine kinase PrsK [Skermanella rosea]|uniref:XrtA/PEP-CTERM system histidine kinase PrsK n=1 Tax=Skermanella rosea TaxID=1817965 RepID=UPI001931B669|nr:XrtA/PEP-CTERM system histidine kinase PrsK [Skermanella rosea]UEM02714.1 PEP-CTERM system histidine kinase PrsK [Skermanella rosea]
MQLDQTMIGAATHGVAALTYLILTALLAGTWRRNRPGGAHGVALIAAVLLTAAWAGAEAFARIAALPPAVPESLLVLRSAGWLLFLLVVLRAVTHGPAAGFWRNPLAAVVGVVTAVALADAAVPLPVGGFADVSLVAGLAMAVLGLLMVENLFLFTRDSARWTFKHLLIGLGGLFAFDLFLHSGALLLGRTDPMALAARPLVQVLAVPFLLVSAARIRTLSFDVTISRETVLHTTALVGSGVYLLGVAAIGYLLRETSMTLGPLVQMLFFMGAVMVLAVLLLSGELRARARMAIARNFFSLTYDYRREWLRFIRTLSDSASQTGLHERAVRAMADLFECSSGALFLRGRGDIYAMAGRYNWSGGAGMLALPNALAERLGERRVVLNLRDGLDLSGDPAEQAVLGWLRRLNAPWLLVPLRLRDEIVGAIVLSEPRAPRDLTWEDEDLLEILGVQVGSYIAEEQASRALFEAQRFERLGQSFSFVAHDLKNMVSQLSLILQHAEKHGDKPEFQRDTLETIGDSVERMRALLGRLRERAESGPDPVAGAADLRAMLLDVVEPRRHALPGLAFGRLDEGVAVAVDRLGFTAAVENLVQNAIDAARGRIRVSGFAEGGHAVVEVADDGPGMTDAFIRDHLFRPFASTKTTGYGIGMYQTRDLIERWGGHLEIESEVGAGTTARVLMPLAAAPSHTERQAIP